MASSSTLRFGGSVAVVFDDLDLLGTCFAFMNNRQAQQVTFEGKAQPLYGSGACRIVQAFASIMQFLAVHANRFNDPEQQNTAVIRRGSIGNPMSFCVYWASEDREMDRIGLYVIYAVVYGLIAWMVIELFVEQCQIFRRKRLRMGHTKPSNSNKKDPDPSDEDQSHKGPLAAA